MKTAIDKPTLHWIVHILCVAIIIAAYGWRDGSSGDYVDAGIVFTPEVVNETSMDLGFRLIRLSPGNPEANLRSEDPVYWIEAKKSVHCPLIAPSSLSDTFYYLLLLLDAAEFAGTDMKSWDVLEGRYSFLNLPGIIDEGAVTSKMPRIAGFKYVSLSTRGRSSGMRFTIVDEDLTGL